jgi:multiple sugar transport system substrate-binding protein/putative aldouronate transport system substrate-binding protein
MEEKMMKKKVLSAILVAAMTVSMVACGSGDSGSSEAGSTGTSGNGSTGTSDDGSASSGTYQLDKITMVVNGTLTATVDNGQEAFEQQWEEAVGIDLEIQQLDHSGYADAVGRMFASGEYPDVMIMSADMYAQYATTGILWDMTEAYENAEFQSRMEYPEVNESLYKNGKLYGFAPAYGNGCVTYLKKAWLDELGIDASTITTFDDYYNMLLAEKALHPDNYGVIAAGYISDEAPYTNYLPEFWQDAYPALLQDDNGTWYDGFQTDATKAAIERIAKGVADGVIDPTTLTNGTKDAREKWFSNNQDGSSLAFTYWAGSWYQTLTDNLIKNEVDSELVELAPIAEVGAYINREAPVWVIIDDQDGDDSREQAIFDAFIETMLDGGLVQTLWTYGAEGVHWSTAASDGFTINAGTENEKVYGPYEEGTFYLLPSPSDENTVWKKNAMDPALVICPLVGDYASYTDISSLAAEGNAFFTSHMKDAPTSPSSEVYTNYAGDIQTARKECIASVVNDGVSVDDAMQTYIDTVGYMVDESLADLNSAE